MPSKENMKCNKPQKSWKPAKKRVVKACSGGKEKIIHFGASGYGNNYNSVARKSFRARHKCDTANDKLTARYWSCKNLWSNQSDIISCPKNRRCKGASPKRKSVKKRKSPSLKSRRRPVKKSTKKRKSVLVKSRRRSVKKSAKKRKSPRKSSRK